MTSEAVPLEGVVARELDTGQSIACGFRTEFFEAFNGEEKVGAALSTGGFGGDWIILEWRDRSIGIRASELLKAWIARDFPDDLELVPR